MATKTIKEREQYNYAAVRASKTALEGLAKAVKALKRGDRYAEAGLEQALDIAEDALTDGFDQWDKWAATTPPEVGFAGEDPPIAAFRNNLYEVWAYRAIHRDPESGEDAGPPLIHLSIKRRDRLPIDYNRWRILQRIKDELLGEDVECVELYPRADRLVDTSHQYHLWALPTGFLWPIPSISGESGRCVASGPLMPKAERWAREHGVPGIVGAKQRPYEPDEEPADEATSNPEIVALCEEAGLTHFKSLAGDEPEQQELPL